MVGWMREARRRAVRSASWANPALRFGGLAWQARQEVAAVVASLPWDDYDTLTLKVGGRESSSYLWRCHRRWVRKLRASLGRELRQVVALEWQERGTAHAHLLTYGFGGRVPRCEREALWIEAGGGWAACRQFRARGGAVGYCAKYVVKDCELELVGSWPALDGAQLDLGAWG